jgi:hypothetical protein
MSYDEVMRMPLRGFWSLNAQVVRLRAENNMSMIDLFLLGGMGATEKAIEQVRDAYSATMGEPTKVRQPKLPDSEQTKRGLDELRKIKARLDGK